MIAAVHARKEEAPADEEARVDDEEDTSGFLRGTTMRAFGRVQSVDERRLLEAMRLPTEEERADAIDARARKSNKQRQRIVKAAAPIIKREQKATRKRKGNG